MAILEPVVEHSDIGDVGMASSAPQRHGRRDPEFTKREILEVAVVEFSRHGLVGAKIERIAERTQTSKRMIYYYYGSKEELYQAALIDSYRKIRETEVNLQLEHYEPVAGLQLLIRETIKHFEANTDFIRMVLFENTYEVGAIHLMSDDVWEMNQSAVRVLEDLLARGKAQGTFRSGPDAPSARDVHQILSGLVFHRVSCRATFNKLFARDMMGEQDSPRVRAIIEDTVLRFVLVDADSVTLPLGRPHEVQGLL